MGAAGAVALGLGVGVAGVADTATPAPDSTTVPGQVPQATAPPLDDATLDDATLAAAREAIAPSVVALGDATAAPTSDQSGGPGVGTSGGSGGSGVIVRPEGIVVTSTALAAAPVLSVRLGDGRTVGATLVGSDHLTGVAVLDLDGDGYPYADLAQTPPVAAPDPLAPGTPAVTVAAPPPPSVPADDDVPRPGRTNLRATLASATSPSAHAGQARGAERIVRDDGAVLEGVVAVGGIVAPATLGGPVVTDAGTLAGVTTVVQDEALAYATPVDVVGKVVDDVLADGRVHHAWLGVEGIDTAPDQSDRTDQAFGLLGDDPGIVLTGVSPAGPGAAAGLRADDVVLAIGGRPVQRMPEFVRWLRSWSPGETAELTIERDGVRSMMLVSLAELPT